MDRVLYVLMIKKVNKNLDKLLWSIIALIIMAKNDFYSDLPLWSCYRECAQHCKAFGTKEGQLAEQGEAGKEKHVKK